MALPGSVASGRWRDQPCVASPATSRHVGVRVLGCLFGFTDWGFRLLALGYRVRGLAFGVLGFGLARNSFNKCLENPSGTIPLQLATAVA